MPILGSPAHGFWALPPTDSGLSRPRVLGSPAHGFWALPLPPLRYPSQPGPEPLRCPSQPGPRALPQADRYAVSLSLQSRRRSPRPTRPTRRAHACSRGRWVQEAPQARPPRASWVRPSTPATGRRPHIPPQAGPYPPPSQAGPARSTPNGRRSARLGRGPGRP